MDSLSGHIPEENWPSLFCRSSGTNRSSAALGLHAPLAYPHRDFCLASSYAGPAHISRSHCEVMCTADHASSISFLFLASRLQGHELPCVLPAGIVIELGWFFTAFSSLVSYSGIPKPYFPSTIFPPFFFLSCFWILYRTYSSQCDVIDSNVCSF